MFFLYCTFFDGRVIYFFRVAGEVKNGSLQIGETKVPVSTCPEAVAMVPNVLFYDNDLVRKHVEYFILCV